MINDWFVNGRGHYKPLKLNCRKKLALIHRYKNMEPYQKLVLSNDTVTLELLDIAGGGRLQSGSYSRFGKHFGTYL